MELQDEFIKINGHIAELTQTVQQLDDNLGPLVERDLVAGVVQMQINLDRMRTWMKDNIVETVEKSAAMSKYKDLEARVEHMEAGFSSLGDVVYSCRSMEQSMQVLLGMPPEHIKAAMELAVKVGEHKESIVDANDPVHDQLEMVFLKGDAPWNEWSGEFSEA